MLHNIQTQILEKCNRFSYNKVLNHEEEGLLVPDANKTCGDDSLLPLKFLPNYPSGYESSSSSGMKKKKRK
jgi:hypothetical protein